MVNINQYCEDLRCTEFYTYEEELRENINEALSNFLNEIGEEEYQFVSDKHIMFMDEYNDDKLQEILEEVYDNLIEELEELEE